VTDWRPVKTMPLTKTVIVKTVTGLVCPAKAVCIPPWAPGDPGPVPRIECRRRDTGGRVMAVAWQPYEKSFDWCPECRRAAL
jgi:hypothetical protein